MGIPAHGVCFGRRCACVVDIVKKENPQRVSHGFSMADFDKASKSGILIAQTTRREHHITPLVVYQQTLQDGTNVQSEESVVRKYARRPKVDPVARKEPKVTEALTGSVKAHEKMLGRYSLVLKCKGQVVHYCLN